MSKYKTVLMVVLLFIQVAIRAQDAIVPESHPDLCSSPVLSGDALNLLNTAILRNDATCVSIYLRSGVDPNSIEIGNDYSAPIIVATTVESSDILRILLEGGVDKRSLATGRAFSILCMKGKNNLVDEMLDLGVPVDVRDRDGTTGLIAASAAGKADTVEILLNRGADVNAKALSGGFSSLMVATDDKKLATLLIKHGAAINATDSYGWSAVHHAIFRSNLTLIEELIANAADINLKNKRGLRPLKFAMQQPSSANRQKIIDLLRRSGAKK